MSPQDRDEEHLQRYLQGDSDLSRAYRRDAGEEPGADLDARILAEAHRAVAHRQRVAHSPFARSWMVPASLAAVLVLSVSVVLLMPDPALETGIDRDDAAEPAPVPSVSAVPKREHAAGRREQSLDDKEDRAGEAAVGRLRAPAVAEPADRPQAKTAKKARAAQTPVQGAAGGAANVLEAAPAAAAVHAPEESRLAEEAEAQAPSKDTLGPPHAPEPEPADAVQADPAAWLRFIEQLVDAHDLDGAKSNLRAFRRRYPDYPLPPSLALLAASLDAQTQ